MEGTKPGLINTIHETGNLDHIPVTYPASWYQTVKGNERSIAMILEVLIDEDVLSDKMTVEDAISQLRQIPVCNATRSKATSSDAQVTNTGILENRTFSPYAQLCKDSGDSTPSIGIIFGE